MRRRPLLDSVLAGFMVFACGCASFPARRIPLTTDLPDQSRFLVKPSVYFATRFLTDLSGGKEPPVENAAPLPRLRQIVEKVATDASLFRSYTFESFEAKDVDYVLQLEMLNYGSGGGAVGAGFITGITLFVIPTAVTDNYELKARLVDRNGQVIKTYTYDDGIRTWLGIWLVPLAGNTPSAAVNSVWENMIRTLFRDLLDDNALFYSHRDDVRRDIAGRATPLAVPSPYAQSLGAMGVSPILAQNFRRVTRDRLAVR